MSLSTRVRILTSLRLVAVACCLAGGVVAGVPGDAAMSFATASVAGSSYVPVGPVRVLDTRNGTGTGGVIAPVARGGQVRLQVEGVAGVPASGVTAVVLNVTVTDVTQGGYVTVYPDGGSLPLVSNLNFTTGETIPNLVVVPVGADGKVDLYNAGGASDLVADLAGYYTPGGAAWGNAIEVPGTAALNTGGAAEVTSVSCPSAGNCAAGGDYNVSGASSPGPNEPFVADEVNGTWGAAVEVPGITSLNTFDHAYIDSVSCGSTGSCAAVGQYEGNSGYQAFVADEVNGTWDDAIQIPGVAGLNTSQAAEPLAVSCSSAGNCALGGYYDGSSGHEAFVADEVTGSWDNAVEVPGTAALNTGGNAFLQSVSCASAGNCAAGGEYTDSSGHRQAFVADEANGIWGIAIEVPGTAALNTGGLAEITSVSCASGGNCVVGGSYTDNSGHTQAFVAAEVSGSWGDAVEVPGTAALNTGDAAEVSSVSCSSAGNCAAVGRYVESSQGSSSYEAFAAAEVSGSWGQAIQIPGTATLNTGGPSWATSVSCPSAGSCVAGGQAVTPSTGPGGDGFVVSETNGTWGAAILVAGLNTDNAEVFSVSCPPTGSCAAGGTYYPTGSGSPQAFVVGQS